MRIAFLWQNQIQLKIKHILLFISLLPLTLQAQGQAYPNVDYAENVPTLEAVIGHATGEELSSITEIATYFEALAAAAPSKMRLQAYAESWQGNTLSYAIISSPENIARLDEIKSNLAQLTSGEALSSAARARLLAETPAVSWLGYGVHGDEVTPSESALFMAYHLLAAQDDALVDTILQNTIVIIDPDQNPDGRDRFIHGFKSALGLVPQSDRYAAEHVQPWPRGRFNHYVFDLNRDWFALTQPETQGKVAALLEWQPVTFVDSHEMGGDNTYYFPPPARPFNPNISQDQQSKQVQMGRNHASWFDRFGISYFTREIFDAFYPGYGDMWPTLNGSIAQTFEQGSPRGLVFERLNGELLTYAEGVRNNFIASLSTLEVVAKNKDAYLGGLSDFRRAAVAKAERSRTRYVVIDLAERRYEAERMARRLDAQGIMVLRTPGGTDQCGSNYSQGALIIDLAQGQGTLARTLLETSTPLSGEFLAEQNERRARNLRHELYDVTAWSLPLMDGLSAQQCRDVSLASARPVTKSDPITSRITGQGDFGYAIPWVDSGQARLVIAGLKAGLVGRTTDEAFTQNGKVFPSGSVVFAAQDNAADYAQKLRGLAQDMGAELVGMPNSWVEDGPNFGSSAFRMLKLPKIAMAWGEGTSPTSAGNTRFVLERHLGLSVTPIRMSTLPRADLSTYDVLVVPDIYDDLTRGSLLKSFVRKGGVLVGIESALDSFIHEDVGLLTTQTEYAATSAEAGELDEEASKAPGLLFEDRDAYSDYITDPTASPEDVPGVLVKTIANTDHWLAAGYETATALVTGSDIYRPLNQSDGTNVLSFAGADELLLSGHLWDENLAQLAYKPFVMAQRSGKGVTIGFTQSPTTRAYLNGLDLLMANAVLLGPARMTN